MLNFAERVPLMAILVLVGAALAGRADAAPASSPIATAVRGLAQNPPASAGTVMRDCSDCPDMVYIPAGSIAMTEPGNSGPSHRVVIPSFWMGRTTVTFAQWDECVAAGPCPTSANDLAWGRDNRPVINVSWNDAQRYLQWISAKTGHVYRLPSAAEWEYAARAGTTTRFYWGDEVGTGHANCNDCGGALNRQQTAPVGSFAPNPWGLYDMWGNVSQWIDDCGASHGHPGGSAATLCKPEDWREQLGGSWYDAGERLDWTYPNNVDRDNANGSLGFRLARMD